MEYLQFGGFPAVVLEQNLKRKSALLTEIFTSYFEKDAKNLADFRDMAKLRDLILLLVPRVGSQVEILKLANALGVARETIYNYLSFLEQTYVVSLLPKHSSSIDRRAAGSKKLYFCDTGLARALGDMSQGQSVEQSVFQCLRGNHALSFYHKNQTNEIDFILDDKIALEVKMSMSQRDMANLIIRSKTLLLQELYIASLEYTDHPNAILLTDL
jgi:predicted AAA+ superfamily ATPase